MGARERYERESGTNASTARFVHGVDTWMMYYVDRSVNRSVTTFVRRARH